MAFVKKFQHTNGRTLVLKALSSNAFLDKNFAIGFSKFKTVFTIICAISHNGRICHWRLAVYPG